MTPSQLLADKIATCAERNPPKETDVLDVVALYTRYRDQILRPYVKNRISHAAIASAYGRDPRLRSILIELDLVQLTPVYYHAGTLLAFS